MIRRPKLNLPTYCNKKKFDEATAKDVVTRAKRSDDPRRHEKRYYWCKICHAYHVTSQESD